MSPFRFFGREIVVDDFPITVAAGGEVGTAVWSVRIVHHKGLVVIGIGVSSQQLLQRTSVGCVRGRFVDACQLKQRRE